MNYLSIENLTKSFGDRIIFENITFGIDQGQKVAIVAKNGSGKTTLLRCIYSQTPGGESSDEIIDSGRIVFRKDLRIAFMEQNEALNDKNTILEEIFSHDLPELKAVKEYNLAMRLNDEDLIANSFEAITELNAWDIEVRVNQILSVLKLEDTSKLVSTLSGGQQKRVALAKVLVAEADILILDEPTNHLDLDMIEWLEGYLSKSKATILMVTHDRYFLEVVCDTILELEDQTIYKYKGNFSYYLEKKAERNEQRESTVGKAKNQFRKELEWMRRQPKARGTKQKARIEAFHDVKSVAKQRLDTDELEIPVKMERLGSKILEMHHVGKNFGDLKILNDLTYTFKRNERLGIVGKNGAGKSTFLNMILGLEGVSKGKVVTGETVVFGYYSQELLKTENESQKVIDVIRDIAEFIPLEKGRQMSAAQFLEKFLFPRSMHFNFVHKLSGGEKRRLKLMTILMKNPNFLILDEPTNDLDIFVMSVLEEYLRGFQGCLIVVSHDRYFMDKMVDHLFVFEGEGEIKDLLGNYTAYRKQLQSKNSNKKTKIEPEEIVKVSTLDAGTPKEKIKLTYKENAEFVGLEGEMEKLEQEKAQLTQDLSDVNTSNEDLMIVGEKLSKVVNELETKTDRWLELSEYV
ncbi:MAG: ABC-F family ATP-binding cassette domain-containing protein [Flavobacteriales bacterium]